MMQAMKRKEAEGAGAQVLAEVLNWFEKPAPAAEPAPEQSSGPFVPAALGQAFATLAEAGLGPRQLRLVEAIFDQALAQIFAEALARHPNDIGVLAKWLYHLRIEPVTPTTSILSG